MNVNAGSNDTEVIKEIDDSNPAAPDRIPTWRLALYGLGDSFGGGGQTMVTLLYLVFLTDVMRISPALAGTIFLISRFYDAVTDPFEGLISDRTRTRLGRRKPYLIIGVPLIVLSMTLLFTGVDFKSEMARWWYALAMFLIYGTVNSLVMLNYHALSSEMVQDYNDRTKLRSFQLIASVAMSFIINLIPLRIIQTVPDQRRAYMLAGLVGGLILCIGTIFAVIFGKERPELSKEAPKGFKFKTDIIQPLTNKTYVSWMGMIVFYFTANVIPTTLTVYFMRDYLNRRSEAGAINNSSLIGMLIAILVGMVIARAWGKRKTFIIATLLQILTRLAMFLIVPDQPASYIYVIYFLTGFFSGLANLVMFAMLTDMPDIDELASGVRREGIYMSLQQLARKSADGLSVFLAANLIGTMGYILPVEETVDGVTTLVAQPQTDSFISALRILFVMGPVFFNILSLVCAFVYKLTPTLYEEVKMILVKRRAGEPLTPAEEGRSIELKNLLVNKNW